jgi:hypothetical protein
MAAAARLLLRRAASAVAEAAAGRPSALAPARRPGVWAAALSAAVAEAPRGAAPSSDFFAVLGSLGVPTALVVAATTGAFLAVRQFGELSAKVAASDKAIAAAIAVSEAKLAAYKESAASAVAATEAKLAASEKAATAVIAANKESSASAVAAIEAKLAANKESSASAVAATEAKLAAAEKVIAAMMAGVPVAAELATLKALKGEPKREEARKSELKEQGR